MSDTDHKIGDVLRWSVGNTLRYKAVKTGPDEWHISSNIVSETVTKSFAWLRSVIDRGETHGLTRNEEQVTSRYGYTDKFLDVTGPMGPVEIEVKKDGSVIWVHTDGRTILRVCGITDEVIVNDHRSTR